MVPGSISFLSEPEEPKATIRSTPAIAMAARLARKLIRCGGRPVLVAHEEHNFTAEEVGAAIGRVHALFL